MPKRFWWPGSIPEQLIFIEHFSSYTSALGLTPDQEKAAEAVLAASLTALNPTDHLRDHISFGRAERLPTPVFPYMRPMIFTIGLGSQFFDLRDKFEALADHRGFEDDVEHPLDDNEMVERTFASGYWVIISGSTRSRTAMPV
jgi:hypothetical protein